MPVTTKTQLNYLSLNYLNFALTIRTKKVAALISINYAYLYLGEWLDGSLGAKLIQSC